MWPPEGSNTRRPSWRLKSRSTTSDIDVFTKAARLVGFRSDYARPRSAKVLHSHALGGQNRMKTEHYQRSCHSRPGLVPDAGPPANARSNILERTRRIDTTQCNDWSHNVNLGVAMPCPEPPAWKSALTRDRLRRHGLRAAEAIDGLPVERVGVDAEANANGGVPKLVGVGQPDQRVDGVNGLPAGVGQRDGQSLARDGSEDVPRAYLRTNGDGDAIGGQPVVTVPPPVPTLG